MKNPEEYISNSEMKFRHRYTNVVMYFLAFWFALGETLEVTSFIFSGKIFSQFKIAN